MKEFIRVSIIIPVYNTEEYLDRCIQSCLMQTIDDIEIILVDDCSADGSRDIILKYYKEYPDKIRYIFQTENQRQGAARNRGMEIASGDYLIFVDSDDWIEPDMCESLYECAVKTQADMVGSDYFKTWDDRDETVTVNILPEFLGYMDFRKKDGYTKKCGLFWTRIYKRSFLEKCGLKFPEQIFYEDAFFNFYSILYADGIEHTKRPFYHYYQGNQSTVRNRNNPHQYERIDLAEYILEYGRSRSELAEYMDIIEYKYLYMQGANLIYTCLGMFDKPDKDKMKLIDKGIKEAIENVFSSHTFKQLSAEFRFYMRLNSISSTVCVFCYKHRIYAYVEILLNKLKRRKKRAL